MRNSNNYIQSNKNVPGSNLHGLTKRLIINEIKLEKIIEEQKLKKQILARLKSEFVDFICIASGITLGLLISTKLHF